MDATFNFNEGTFKELLAKGIDNPSIVIPVQNISKTATKEYKLELAIDKMEKTWEHLNFELVKWKNKDFYIIKGSNIEEL